MIGDFLTCLNMFFSGAKQTAGLNPQRGWDWLAKNPWAEAQGVNTDVCIEIWSLIGQRHAPSRLQESSAAKVGQEAGKLINQARGASRQTV